MQGPFGEESEQTKESWWITEMNQVFLYFLKERERTHLITAELCYATPIFLEKDILLVEKKKFF